MPLSDNDVALFFNAYDGNLNKVRALLLDGANVNAQDSYGATALYIASQNGHLEVVRELLQHDNVDVNLQCTDDGATALIMASQNGHLEVVRALLQHSNVDVNLQRTNGATALNMASENGRLEVVRALLQHDNVDVNLQSTGGLTALYMASQNGHLEVVRELLQNSKVDVNLQSTDDDSTALYMASNEGHVDVVRELLQNSKVDVNILGTDDCDTALHAASVLGGLEVFRELLQHSKVDVNAKNKDGDTVLSMASQHNNLDVVGILLQYEKVDVNAQNRNGETALFNASREGHEESVKKLLEHNAVDVNLPCNTGATPLHVASHYDRGDVVRELLQNSNVDANLKDNDELTALEVAYEHRQFAAIKAFLDHTKTMEKVNKNRESLAKVMTTCKAEPVELSYHYIKRCIKIREIGSGAYGNVFLFEDRDLPEPNKFAVKMIKFSQSSDGPNDEDLKSFEKEFSTLKRFRHPNILNLYGYNFKGSAGEHFLVCEFAANGSLDRFLKDDDMRACLSAATRLSIMHQVASAVDFLHSGAAGFKVLHRDIKSANIYLTEDFTPKLIGCALATFVEDERNAFPSATIMQTSATGGPAIGTIGYVCPEYALNRARQIDYDYIPAYDVYSLGVVMTELIIGRLNDGDPTNVFETYVLNGKTPIVGGWQQLINDADGQADWNAGALELVCKTAIGCLVSSSQESMSMNLLVALLGFSVLLNAGQTYAMLHGINQTNSKLNEILRKGDISLQISSDPDGAGNDVTCYFDKRLFVVKCKAESHPLCSTCLDKAVEKAPASTRDDFQLRCLVVGCSSEPFTFDDLYRHINGNVWQNHLNKIVTQYLIEIKRSQDISLKAQALQNAYLQQSMVCPNVVVIKPSAADPSTNLQKWFKNPAKQKYKVTFYCERSGDQGHDPFEISVDKQWMVTVLPLLQIAIDIAAAWEPSKVLQAVGKTYRIKVHTEEMIALIEALGVKKKHGEKQTLKGDTLKAMAKMANEHESKWRTKMEPVLLENGRTIWVRCA